MAKSGVVAGVVVLVVGGTVGAIVALRHPRPAPPPPTTRPVPVTQPATKPARVKRKPTLFATYLDAVRSANPAVAATQPLGTPVELADAAHLVLHDPVYVEPAGNLWITRPDGQPTTQLLAKLPDGPEYVLRDRPTFVHWYQDDNGTWLAALVVATPDGYDLITAAGRSHLCGKRPFRWAAAYSVPALGKFVVPTDVGVSVFDVTPTPVERYHALPGCAAGTTTPPVTTLDSRGLLAWAPWDNGHPGSAGVSRFVDNAWTDLPPADWPAKPIHLSALLDGSVLRIGAGAPPPASAAGVVESLDGPTTAPAPPTAAAPTPVDGVTLSIAPLDTNPLESAHVDALVAQLSDPDPDKRQAAFAELSRYGPSLWPVLDREAPDQPPEGQVRIRQLLRGKLAPALGGMTLVDDRLTVARRQPDGTLICFAPAGVQVPTDQENDPQVVTPAWLAIHPDGRVDRPLPDALVADQRPDAPTLRAVADEWLVLDGAGPRRFFGNAFVPLLAPDEHRFTDLVAVAARHRWVFRDPATGDTLLIDPTIADPVPHLPVWIIDAGIGGTVGWDDRGNPVVRHAQPHDPNAAAAPPPDDPTRHRAALVADGWAPLAPTDAVHTEATPTTRPTTGPSILLRLPDGTTYADGREAIETVDPAGHRTRWPLPAAAVGTTVDPVLMRTDDGLLFLYNAPGRLLRIRPTPPGPDADQPFKLEATFTADLPNDDHPTRVWLDPAGRIDFITDDRLLTVTFPAGHVPKPIAEMMPAPTHP
jgi:hypothetical protein